MEIDRNGFERLERDECLRLLSTTSLGRVAASVRALPVVLPVMFAMDGESVVIRTTTGATLDAINDAVLAFEADEIDECRHRGWSVLVRGVGEEITDPDERRRAARLPIPAWGGATIDVDRDIDIGDDADGDTDGNRFVRIPLKVVSGRRVPA